MKKTILVLLSFILFSCTNDDDGTRSSLPPITSEGRNTFGCKIDRQTFLPKSKGGFSAGYTTILRANYAYFPYEYYGLEPGYHFRISAFNALTNKSVSIELRAFDSALVAGETYPIVLKAHGAFSGEYRFSTLTQDPDRPFLYIHESYTHNTTDQYTGEITFNRIDEENHIISGVFYFDCVNSETNQETSITDGRFDLIYRPSF